MEKLVVENIFKRVREAWKDKHPDMANPKALSPLSLANFQDPRIEESEVPRRRESPMRIIDSILYTPTEGIQSALRSEE